MKRRLSRTRKNRQRRARYFTKVIMPKVLQGYTDALVGELFAPCAIVELLKKKAAH